MRILLSRAKTPSELVFLDGLSRKYCVNRNPFVSWEDLPRYAKFVHRSEALQCAEEVYKILEELRCLSKEELELLHPEQSIVPDVNDSNKHTSSELVQPIALYVPVRTGRSGTKVDTKKNSNRYENLPLNITDIGVDSVENKTIES